MVGPPPQRLVVMSPPGPAVDSKRHRAQPPPPPAIASGSSAAANKGRAGRVPVEASLQVSSPPGQASTRSRTATTGAGDDDLSPARHPPPAISPGGHNTTRTRASASAASASASPAEASRSGAAHVSMHVPSFNSSSATRALPAVFMTATSRSPPGGTSSPVAVFHSPAASGSPQATAAAAASAAPSPQAAAAAASAASAYEDFPGAVRLDMPVDRAGAAAGGTAPGLDTPGPGRVQETGAS